MNETRKESGKDLAEKEMMGGGEGKRQDVPWFPVV